MSTRSLSRVGSATLRWRRAGTGPDLVFVHGFPLTADTWDGVIGHLRHRFTCRAMDLIGLGGSRSDCADDYTAQGQARILQQLISDWGVRSYALVGNDTGGWIARELALLDPDRVTHLILTNTEIPGHRPPWIPLYQKLARAPGFAAALRQLLKSRAFCRSPMGFGGCFDDKGRIDGAFRTRYVDPLIDSPAATDQALRLLTSMRFDRLDELAVLHASIRAPTTFLWGQDDPTFPLAHARRMTQQFSCAVRFESVPDAKLFFYEEYPELAAALIERAVRGTASPDPAC